MKELKNIAGCTELGSEEMNNIDGGSTIGELIANGLGKAFGALARLQELNGDTGQWMA